MIRVEIALKTSWGNSLDGKIERRLKAEILQAVQERAELDDLEIVRVQFLGPPPARKKARA